MPFQNQKICSAPLVDGNLEYSKGGQAHRLPPLPIVTDFMLHTLYGRSLAFDTTAIEYFWRIYSGDDGGGSMALNMEDSAPFTAFAPKSYPATGVIPCPLSSPSALPP
jgi:hypothetical protein